MLHKVNLPTTQPGLEWVLDMQNELVRGLSQPGVSSTTITAQWVATQLSSLHPLPDPDWLHKLCCWAGKPTAFLEALQKLADYPQTTRQALLKAFENDRQFHQDFEAQSGQPHTFVGLTSLNLRDKAERKRINEFFLWFYKDGLKAGYKFIQAGSHGFLNRQYYLDAWYKANPNLEVCPFCDGYPTTHPEVDHFYPKASYAYLSCHPYNLVPICGNCNGIFNKGQKPPINLSAARPNLDWFHPYLRPLYDWTLKSSPIPASQYFEVRFNNLPIKNGFEVVSQDSQTQTRLENLESLVHYQAEWFKILKQHIHSVGNMLDRWKAKGRINSKADFIDRLSEEADNTFDDIGRKGYSILMYYYYQAAVDEVPTIFDELWDYFTNGNSLAEAS